MTKSFLYTFPVPVDIEDMCCCCDDDDEDIILDDDDDDEAIMEREEDSKFSDEKCEDEFDFCSFLTVTGDGGKMRTLEKDRLF